MGLYKQVNKLPVIFDHHLLQKPQKNLYCYPHYRCSGTWFLHYIQGVGAELLLIQTMHVSCFQLKVTDWKGYLLSIFTVQTMDRGDCETGLIEVSIATRFLSTISSQTNPSATHLQKLAVSLSVQCLIGWVVFWMTI